MTTAVVAFGELLWDILPSSKVLGGAPANFAFRLTTLGTPTVLVSRVGSDALGDQALAYLSERSISVEALQRDPRSPTGTVKVALAADGSASYVIHPDTAYDRIEFTSALQAHASRACAVYFGTLAQRSRISRSTLYDLLEHAASAIKFLDVNLRKDCFSAETVRASLGYADVVKLSEEEVAVVAELLQVRGAAQRPQYFVEEVIERFELQACVVTRGARGILAAEASGLKVDLPGHQVKVIDTIGAGDSFTAAFVARKLRGDSFEDCCRFANRVGAATAATRGGMTALTEAQIDELVPDS